MLDLIATITMNPVDPTGFRNGKEAVIFVSQNSNGKKCDYGKKPEKR